uniref:Uncharacterized protein n=1 Tax=Solanum tuberosum TaxID=4113 RepID=M1DMW7_SOLTU
MEYIGDFRVPNLGGKEVKIRIEPGTVSKFKKSKSFTNSDKHPFPAISTHSERGKGESTLGIDFLVLGAQRGIISQPQGRKHVALTIARLFWVSCRLSRWNVENVGEQRWEAVGLSLC